MQPPCLTPSGFFPRSRDTHTHTQGASDEEEHLHRCLSFHRLHLKLPTHTHTHARTHTGHRYCHGHAKAIKRGAWVLGSFLFSWVGGCLRKGADRVYSLYRHSSSKSRLVAGLGEEDTSTQAGDRSATHTHKHKAHERIAAWIKHV